MCCCPFTTLLLFASSGCLLLAPEREDTSPPLLADSGDSTPESDSGSETIPGCGWEFNEEEPNDVSFADDISLVVEELGNANVLPAATLRSCTDVIHGSARLDSGETFWNDDLDVFALNVGDETHATIGFGSVELAVDHDLLLYDAEGRYQACSLHDDPVQIDTAGWGFSLPEGSTWYIAVLPYAGGQDEPPYALMIDYTTP